MALIMQGVTPAAGYPGMWANMETCNSFTGVAESEFGFAVPLAWGATAGDSVVPLTDGNRFVGISLSNIYTSGEPTGTGNDATQNYGEADILGVATMGCLFVGVGEDVERGDLPFYDPADGLYYAAAGAGRLPLPQAEFDGPGAADGVAVLRLNITPGGEEVTAGV